jgi:hypothetical protein
MPYDAIMRWETEGGAIPPDHPETNAAPGPAQSAVVEVARSAATHEDASAEDEERP